MAHKALPVLSQKQGFEAAIASELLLAQAGGVADGVAVSHSSFGGLPSAEAFNGGLLEALLWVWNGR